MTVPIGSSSTKSVPLASTVTVDLSPATVQDTSNCTGTELRMLTSSISTLKPAGRHLEILRPLAGRRWREQ